MREDVPVLTFEARKDFREWLDKNSETSEGVWLLFGKTGTVVTLSANDALEEALSFGWIDGQMRRVDETKYHKYFSKRRPGSVWSEKNKKLVLLLRDKGLMTGRGETAVDEAKNNGRWDEPKANPITEEQVASLQEKLEGFSPACENFCNMSASVRRTYTKRYFSFKSEEARQRDLAKIIDRLNKNLKPM